MNIRAVLLVGCACGTLVAGTAGCFALQQTGVTSDRESSWVQWRGNNRDGSVSPAGAWPGSLDEKTLRQVWRIPLGPSYSGPVVSADSVFTTETEDRKREVVRAFDRRSGTLQWQQSWEGALSVPFFAKANGDWIRSTPAFDGDCLYVGGMRDLLVCLDATSGEIRWQVDFVRELSTAVPDFGFVCSPLVDGEHLYVQAGAGCCKLDKKTGRILWRTLEDAGGMWGSAFSSPVLATLAGKRQLLVQTREKLAGVDLESGDVLWSQVIPTFRGMNILTPVVHGGTVFTSAYQGNSFLFRIDSKDGSFSASEAWTNRARGYMSSPVVIGGHLYLHLQNQRFTCIDLATGETCWTTEPFGKYWSLVTCGERILALDESGDLLLIQANPEKFELIDRRKVCDQPAWGHLAVCDNCIYLRELNALTAWRWDPEPGIESPK